MRVRIEKTDDPQMYLIVLDEKEAVFPTEPVEYLDPDVARKNGFNAIVDIFTNPKVLSVQAGQLDSIDMFAVILKEGETWGDPSSAVSEAHSMKGYIDRFLTRKEAIYQNPAEAKDPTQDELDQLLQQKFYDASSVFYTVKKHGANVKIEIDPNDRVFIVELDEQCTDSCDKGSPVTTKRGIGRELRQFAPNYGVRHIN